MRMDFLTNKKKISNELIRKMNYKCWMPKELYKSYKSIILALIKINPIKLFTILP